MPSTMKFFIHTILFTIMFHHTFRQISDAYLQKVKYTLRK